ncbi:MAG: hypothetical protein V9F04_07715 [Dermatophilaceae bacterium]
MPPLEVRMQFLFGVIDDATATASAEEMSAIRALNDQMRAGGHRVFAGGLAAPDMASTVDNRDGRALITPGALATGPAPSRAAATDAEAAGASAAGAAQGGAAQGGAPGPGTAYLSGLWIVDVPDETAALTLAAEASRACNRRVEVRAFLE